jgi:response regulator RpfG family c-di-GMP phosphodiesterase
LRRCAGRQFDPEVVQAFTEINEHEWRGAFESATVPMRSAAA